MLQARASAAAGQAFHPQYFAFLPEVLQQAPVRRKGFDVFVGIVDGTFFALMRQPPAVLYQVPERALLQDMAIEPAIYNCFSPETTLTPPLTEQDVERVVSTLYMLELS